MAKNCGKTTTLNVLSAAYHEAERVIGLVSIGIDGESSDVLIGTPKPPVDVRVGDLLVTADSALDRSDARFEWVESLGVRTPLGETVLARALGPGEVILGGLRHRGDVERAIDRLLANGAEHVVVDGAYGRVTAASPELTDGAILSTGAVVSSDVGELASETMSLVERWAIGRCDDPVLRALGRESKARGVALLGGDAEPVALPSNSTLLGLQRGRDLWCDEIDSIAVPGLVSDGVVDELLSARMGGDLVVADATSIQCSNANFQRLSSLWRVTALESISLKAIAINPTSVRGATIDARAFARMIVEAAPNLTVFDPLLGLHSLV